MFAPEAPEFGPQGDRERWSMRALRDMRAGPLTCCYPGFMGAACERLVARGFAVREAAGELPMPEFWPNTAKGRREWRERGPHPMFRYRITERGERHLAAG